MLIDGYNVIHKIPELSDALDISLLTAREKLARYCQRWLTARKDVDQFCLIFDGSSEVLDMSGPNLPGIRSIYTKTEEKADDRILDMIYQLEGACRFIVVSDDNYVRRNSVKHDTTPMSVAEFQQTLKRGIKSKASRAKGKDNSNDKSSLSPIQEDAITRSLMKEWGLKGDND